MISDGEISDETEKMDVRDDDINGEISWRRVKLQRFVHYPIENWSTFVDESRMYFIKRYFKRKIKKKELNMSDFEMISTLHVGKHSKVLLGQWKNKDFMVVKIREKEQIVRNYYVQRIKREIRFANFIKFPFAMNGYFVQDNVYLYNFMSFACGNSLKNLIRTRILDEKEAKFYSAQVVLALEFLHSIGVVHRGIEASNILICHDGYIKLTGFSKSKIGLGKRKSLINLDVYSIPEMLNEKHGHVYDIWCFGILIFYLCSSRNPVENKTSLTYNTTFEIPKSFSDSLKDICQKLLDFDQCSRIGSKCPSEIRYHKWFDIPWNEIENKKIRPPFLPQCSDPVRYFKTYPTSPLKQSSYDFYDSIFKDCFE